MTVFYVDNLYSIFSAKFVTCEEILAHGGEHWEEGWKINCIQDVLSHASLQNLWFAIQFKENPTLIHHVNLTTLLLWSLRRQKLNAWEKTHKSSN